MGLGARGILIFESIASALVESDYVVIPISLIKKTDQRKLQVEINELALLSNP